MPMARTSESTDVNDGSVDGSVELYDRPFIERVHNHSTTSTRSTDDTDEDSTIKASRLNRRVAKTSKPPTSQQPNLRAEGDSRLRNVRKKRDEGHQKAPSNKGKPSGGANFAEHEVKQNFSFPSRDGERSKTPAPRHAPTVIGTPSRFIVDGGATPESQRARGRGASYAGSEDSHSVVSSHNKAAHRPIFPGVGEILPGVQHNVTVIDPTLPGFEDHTQRPTPTNPFPSPLTPVPEPMRMGPRLRHLSDLETPTPRRGRRRNSSISSNDRDDIRGPHPSEAPKTPYIVIYQKDPYVWALFGVLSTTLIAAATSLIAIVELSINGQQVGSSWLTLLCICPFVLALIIPLLIKKLGDNRRKLVKRLHRDDTPPPPAADAGTDDATTTPTLESHERGGEMIELGTIERIRQSMFGGGNRRKRDQKPRQQKQHQKPHQKPQQQQRQRPEQGRAEGKADEARQGQRHQHKPVENWIELSIMDQHLNNDTTTGIHQSSSSATITAAPTSHGPARTITISRRPVPNLPAPQNGTAAASTATSTPPRPNKKPISPPITAHDTLPTTSSTSSLARLTTGIGGTGTDADHNHNHNSDLYEPQLPPTPATCDSILTQLVAAVTEPYSPLAGAGAGSNACYSSPPPAVPAAAHLHLVPSPSPSPLSPLAQGQAQQSCVAATRRPRAYTSLEIMCGAAKV